MLEEGLRTLQEAQAFTRLSRSTIYSLMEKGELPFVKIGRRRLLPYRGLIELVARGLTGA
jgi:excisionase family DNA binding protein